MSTGEAVTNPDTSIMPKMKLEWKDLAGLFPKELRLQLLPLVPVAIKLKSRIAALDGPNPDNDVSWLPSVGFTVFGVSLVLGMVYLTYIAGGPHHDTEKHHLDKPMFDHGKNRKNL